MKAVSLFFLSVLVSMMVMSSVMAQTATTTPTDKPEPTKSMPSDPPSTGRGVVQ